MTHYPAHSKIYNIKIDSPDAPKINSSKRNSCTNKNTILLNTVSENPLSGLVAHYDSDSEQEELNGQQPKKLNAKVDDFLQEINKITDIKAKERNNEQDKHVLAWQECFDETTGYPYYWNTETNCVTWEMPEEYKNWLSKSSGPEKKIIDADFLNKPNIKDKMDSIKPPKSKDKNPPLTKIEKKKKNRKKSSDSEDEKIIMITSYSEGSSSESESETKNTEAENTVSRNQSATVMGPHVEEVTQNKVFIKKEIIENIKEENIDETIILARLRTQAKVLHELGGELSSKSIEKSLEVSSKPQSLALVAGYGEDSEPEDEPAVISIFPISTESMEKPNEHQISQSSLFPVQKPIDVKQFETNSNKLQTFSSIEPPAEFVDNKVFKRKKRLGITVDIPKVEKRLKINEEYSEEEERKGFGFETNDNKISFVKTGITFVKADTLNPEQQIDKVVEDSIDKPEDYEEMKGVVSEKVQFLAEGKEAVSAVQIMSIQLQTLELAYKEGGLTQKYLYAWLRQTFVDLEKLEQEAAPEGWLCQWDRSNKRYFYRNILSGETQWEFPEPQDPDIVGGGEAMDICTTPPPNEEPDVAPSSKFREDISTPSPPPPPVITNDSNTTTKNEIQPPLPPPTTSAEVSPPSPPAITVSETQPLPPGVDSPDLPFYGSKGKDKESSTKLDLKDNLVSELDSFYSDIAQLEATTSVEKNETVKTEIENVLSPSANVDVSNDASLKKKKKSKSKLGQGINMKKKAVSTLVEKWKKVQSDYL